MNAPLARHLAAAHPIVWEMKRSRPGKPKPIGEDDGAQQPGSEPEPPKPNTPTRGASCGAMAIDQPLVGAHPTQPSSQ